MIRIAPAKPRVPKGRHVASSVAFAQIWRALAPRSIELVQEHRFHGTRRWRFDFAHLPSKTAIEIDGSVFMFGRHTRGAGYTNDCEKLNEAAALGWLVFRLTTGMVKQEPARWIKLIAETIMKREAQ